jgi:hypothetical protein
MSANGRWDLIRCLKVLNTENKSSMAVKNRDSYGYSSEYDTEG